jgi:hypothetical protein
MLRIPLERLSSDPAVQHAELRNYFCDKDATAKRTEGHWTLTLAWPGGQERHVDPRLDEGLKWWGDDVMLTTMALANRREGRVLRALYDTWTLQSWSEWLARQPHPLPHPPTILHIDDHFDLAPPRLFVEADKFVDAITGAPVNLREPASVNGALNSGALGMGSFLTPFLYTLRSPRVRHLRQPPRTNATIDYEICFTTEPDTLLRPGSFRPAIHLKATAAGIYRITHCVADWLHGIADGPVLLHIDMDYFNNRYDGDGDWRGRRDKLDPELGDQLLKIDELVDAIKTAGIGPRIADIVIAFSPGFFPAEFWGETNERLRAGLEQLS